MGSWRSLSGRDDHRRLPFISFSAALQPLICSRMISWKYLELSSPKNWYGVEIWFTFWKSRLDTNSAKEHAKYRRWYRALCALQHHPSAQDSLCIMSGWILTRITWHSQWKHVNLFGLDNVENPQIRAWEWCDRKVNIISFDAVKWPNTIPVYIFVAYDPLDTEKSQEYNDNWPSQEGYDDFQDIFETREKCMIKIPTHDINPHFFASFINNEYMCMWCVLALLLVTIPSSLVHHGEQLFFLAPIAGDLALATFLLVVPISRFGCAARRGVGLSSVRRQETEGRCGGGGNNWWRSNSS